MIVARLDGKLSRALPGARAECPECRNGVYARHPDNAIRHWAHLPLGEGEVRDCSNDAGEMSEWHRAWQDERADPESIEVYRDGFRADAINEGGFAIEFQHSPIAPETVAAREAHWRKGVWVLDGTDTESGRHVNLMVRPDQVDSDPWRRYRWPRPPALLFRAKWPCWIDLADRGLLQVRNADQGGGNGWLVTHEWFVGQVLNGKRPTLRPHQPAQTSGPVKMRRTGIARPETDEDLTPLIVNCGRAERDFVPQPTRQEVGLRWARPRICGYDHCDNPARLYPAGWRCEAHKPGQKVA